MNRRHFLQTLSGTALTFPWFSNLALHGAEALKAPRRLVCIGLDFLSKIVTFFQGSPVFTAGLPGNLPELRMELHSPTFTAQNEIWSMLKAPYHPSVMYKVTLVLLEKMQSETPAPMVQKIEPARKRSIGQEEITDASPIKQAIVNHPS